MRRILSRLFLLLGCFLLALAPAFAQTSYEDANGRFMFDLPPGWQAVVLANPSVVMLKDAGGAMRGMVYFHADKRDRAALFGGSIDAVEKAYKQVALEEGVVDQQVNGHAARCGAIRHAVSASGVTLTLTTFVGVAVLSQGGLVLDSLPMTETVRPQWQPPLEKIYQSFREVGTKPSGVSDTRTVPPAELPVETVAAQPSKALETAAQPASGAQPATPSSPEPARKGEPTAFNHWLVNLTLPAGWTVQPEKPDEPQGTVADFHSDSVAGNLSLQCNNSRFLNPKKIYDINKRVLKATMPSLVEIQDAGEDKANNGEKMVVGVFRGSATAEGQEVVIHAVVATTKHKSCTLIFLGTIVASPATTGISEILSIAKSVH